MFLLGFTITSTGPVIHPFIQIIQDFTPFSNSQSFPLDLPSKCTPSHTISYQTVATTVVDTSSCSVHGGRTPKQFSCSHKCPHCQMIVSPPRWNLGSFTHPASPTQHRTSETSSVPITHPFPTTLHSVLSTGYFTGCRNFTQSSCPSLPRVGGKLAKEQLAQTCGRWSTWTSSGGDSVAHHDIGTHAAPAEHLG